jgi:hypothetical protein
VASPFQAMVLKFMSKPSSAILKHFEFTRWVRKGADVGFEIMKDMLSAWQLVKKRSFSEMYIPPRPFSFDIVDTKTVMALKGDYPLGNVIKTLNSQPVALVFCHGRRL